MCKDRAKTGATRTRVAAPTNSEGTVPYEAYVFDSPLQMALGRNEIKLNSVIEVYGEAN